MTANLVAKSTYAALLFLMVVCPYGQTQSVSTSTDALVTEGSALLTQHRFREAAQKFQKAIDLNPSLVEAHEGLGVALSREIAAGNVRTADDLDIADRAENHLRQASDLSPSARSPLMELSELEATLAERAADPSERSERYQKAQDLLRRVIDLEPGNAALYLRLANQERDEFAPAIQQAKQRSANDAGPLTDSNLRHALQKQYGNLIHDAIANAKRASELNGNYPNPLLLLSKILRERAIIRDTPEQYAADIHSAEQWRLQFLSVGGHIGQDESAVDH